MLKKKKKKWWNIVSSPQGRRKGQCNKLRTYALYKRELKAEYYVMQDIPKKHKRAFALMRCGSPPLAIEQGRYTGTPLDKRTCTLCDTGDVESEMHMLMSCPMYINTRIDLFHEACLVYDQFFGLGDTEKFIFIMSRPELAKVTAKACFSMLECRRRCLFK